MLSTRLKAWVNERSTSFDVYGSPPLITHAETDPPPFTYWPIIFGLCSLDQTQSDVTNKWGVAIAQWIRMRHPSCSPGFESQAYHQCFYQFLCEFWGVEKTKNKKGPGLAHLKYNKLQSRIIKLWLVKTSHVTCNIQSECLISSKSVYCWHWVLGK